MTEREMCELLRQVYILSVNIKTAVKLPAGVIALK